MSAGRSSDGHPSTTRPPSEAQQGPGLRETFDDVSHHKRHIQIPWDFTVSQRGMNVKKKVTSNDPDRLGLSSGGRLHLYLDGPDSVLLLRHASQSV